MKIIIADDHALFRDGLRMQLQRICPEAHVEEADSYYRVRQGLEQDVPDYLLMDLMMPGMHWRQELPDLVERVQPGRCVVLSGVEDPEAICEAMSMGLAGYIPKRAEPKIIAHALRLVLDGGIYIPPEYMACTIPAKRPAEPEPASQPAARRLLTPRQEEVLRGICAGHSNKQIAYDLSMSEATVKQHVNAVLKALGVHNRTEAAMAAQRQGLLATP